jgi:hypothetical protein
MAFHAPPPLPDKELATPYSPQAFPWGGVALPWPLGPNGLRLPASLPSPSPGVFQGTALGWMYDYLPDRPFFA